MYCVSILSLTMKGIVSDIASYGHSQKMLICMYNGLLVLILKLFFYSRPRGDAPIAPPP